MKPEQLEGTMRPFTDLVCYFGAAFSGVGENYRVVLPATEAKVISRAELPVRFFQLRNKAA
jgi:hypothetical protein